MILIPDKIKLACLPTRIEKLNFFSTKNGPSVYIKRDDETGIEFSGNKIRKLEYSIKEAINSGADYLITCGGTQSNHCRATAAAAAKIGMKVCLVVRGDKNQIPDGNLLLDFMLGAEVYYISSDDYANRRMEIMQEIGQELNRKGHRVYIIPEGASNGIGSFGYYDAMCEIMNQEKELNIHFDNIVIAVGSGGTYAGLFLANKLMNNCAAIDGINIGGNSEYFKNRIIEILSESMNYLQTTIDYSIDEINIIDGYVGKGYAQSSADEIDFLCRFAKTEGIILDPVYTGKAMFGLYNEIQKGRFSDSSNILFIHTGGIFGIFPQKTEFNFSK